MNVSRSSTSGGILDWSETRGKEAQADVSFPHPLDKSHTKNKGLETSALWVPLTCFDFHTKMDVNARRPNQLWTSNVLPSACRDPGLPASAGEHVRLRSHTLGKAAIRNVAAAEEEGRGEGGGGMIAPPLPGRLGHLSNKQGEPPTEEELRGAARRRLRRDG